MARRHTRGEAAVEALLAKLDPHSERYRVLAATRDFKASWVELGERLTEVREATAFSQWGHNNFEAYCRQELHLKPETANKLTRSFGFLRDHEPEVLNTRSERELPPLDVVDLLSRARERAKLSDAQFQSLEQGVFETPTASKGEVLKRFREIDPEAFKPAPKAGAAAGPGDGDLRKALLLAERLQSLLDPQEGVSRAAREGVKTAVHELKKLFEASRKSA
jgi:hypothetical protein